jgi:hypothetical protein
MRWRGCSSLALDTVAQQTTERSTYLHGGLVPRGRSLGPSCQYSLMSSSSCGGFQLGCGTACTSCTSFVQ